MHTDKF